MSTTTFALFGWLVNQPTSSVFSHTKSASATSHQPSLITNQHQLPATASRSNCFSFSSEIMTIYLHCEVVVSILYFNYQNYGFHHFVLHCKHAAHFARTKQEPTSMCSTPTLILILSYVIIRIIMFRELQNTSMLVHQVQTEPKTVHLSKIVDVFYTTVNFLDRSTQTSQVVGPPPCNLLPFFI